MVGPGERDGTGYSQTDSQAPRLNLTSLGILRIGGRLVAMAGLLLTALVLFHAWRLARAPNPWPRRFLAGIGRIAGVRVRTSGHPAPGQVLILANHVSWIDIPALANATGTAFVAHEGLARVRLLKWLCEMNGTIFISRDERATIAKQVATLRAALGEQRTMTVFPEGTTSNGTRLLPFKSALLAALDPLPVGITVQPAWLDYGPLAPVIAWVGTEPGVANFMHILARAEPLELTIHFLAPLTAAELENRKTMAAAARQAIIEAMPLQ